MKRITKRGIAFFIVGILFVILIDVITGWNNSKVAFKNGMNTASELMKP